MQSHKWMCTQNLPLFVDDFGLDLVYLHFSSLFSFIDA